MVPTVWPIGRFLDGLWFRPKAAGRGSAPSQPLYGAVPLQQNAVSQRQQWGGEQNFRKIPISRGPSLVFAYGQVPGAGVMKCLEQTGSEAGGRGGAAGVNGARSRFDQALIAGLSHAQAEIVVFVEQEKLLVEPTNFPESMGPYQQTAAVEPLHGAGGICGSVRLSPLPFVKSCTEAFLRPPICPPSLWSNHTGQRIAMHALAKDVQRFGSETAVRIQQQREGREDMRHRLVVRAPESAVVVTLQYTRLRDKATYRRYSPVRAAIVDDDDLGKRLQLCRERLNQCPTLVRNANYRHVLEISFVHGVSRPRLLS